MKKTSIALLIGATVCGIGAIAAYSYKKRRSLKSDNDKADAILIGGVGTGKIYHDIKPADSLKVYQNENTETQTDDIEKSDSDEQKSEERYAHKIQLSPKSVLEVDVAIGKLKTTNSRIIIQRDKYKKGNWVALCVGDYTALIGTVSPESISSADLLSAVDCTYDIDEELWFKERKLIILAFSEHGYETEQQEAFWIDAVCFAGENGNWICSNCGQHNYYNGVPCEIEFCPNCNRKMDFSKETHITSIIEEVSFDTFEIKDNYVSLLGENAKKEIIALNNCNCCISKNNRKRS